MGMGERTSVGKRPPERRLCNAGVRRNLFRFLQRRYAEGEPMARRALAIIEKITRNNELALAMYFSLLGRLLTALAQLDEAEVLLRLALRSRDEYLAPEHPLIAESCESYA